MTIKPYINTLAICLLASTLLSACTAQRPSVTQEQATVDYNLLLTLPKQNISYHETVKPILERRCVVCHGCYDAPCQLKLSSIEGIERGGSKQRVYDGARIRGIAPTRLFIDAQSTAEWRKKGFHSVLNEGEVTPEKNLERSLMYQLLRLKQRHPQARVGMLSEAFDLRLNRNQVCPTRDEFESYARRRPTWGMPYAMPNLRDEEYTTLVQWIAQGSPVPSPEQSSQQAAAQITQWEVFLNGSSNKEKLVSRYLYEHLFHAHIRFADAPEREFFRLVRSTTPPGQTIDEIATTLPFNATGSTPFYYRLRPYASSIVAKDHVVYQLSSRKMARFHELFLEPDYTVEELPSHTREIASNPFLVYAAIPAESRYRFLLDDARFFIEGFMKGPVCRGQIALNVIEDHFWVFFSNPDHDTFTLDPDVLNHLAGNLQMPTGRGDTLRLFAAWTHYWDKLSAYMDAKQAYFQRMRRMNLDEAMQYIWDGEGHNRSAALTIFRHFDSASVDFGLIGDYPETAWIIDYPLLERIHYLLVAGFNVFGNVGHQLNTRLFMDFLRMEGENNFLAFLPVDKRREIRDSWYVGLRSNLKRRLNAPTDWLDTEVVIGFQSGDPKIELYHHLEMRLAAMAGDPDKLNRCRDRSCLLGPAQDAGQQADQAMKKIASISGPILQVFPDVTFVRIRTGEGTGADLAYTLILNKAYKNVTSMFADEDRRDLEHDTMTVVEGLQGSYPNFFFVIDNSEVQAFAESYVAIRNRSDYERFVGLYGIRRTNPRFWRTADWFQDRYMKQEPVLSGLFDLNRYRNR